MEDSFFGFDTSAPLEDDGGGRIAEPSEEEYDALNDETFGSAINGDWEEAHESLVRMTDNHNGDSKNCNILRKSNRDRFCDLNHQLSSPSTSRVDSPGFINSRRNKNEVDSDLEINLSGMKLDDVDIKFDDTDSIMGNSGLSLDPSVWASIPAKPNKSINNDNMSSVLYSTNNSVNTSSISNIEPFLYQRFPSTFQQKHCQESQNLQPRFPKEMSPFLGVTDIQQPQKCPKICTLEDIERNIIIQQTMQKQHEHRPQQPIQEQDVLNKIPTKPNPQQNSPQQNMQQIHTNKLPQQAPPKGPPGFNQLQMHPRPSNIFNSNLAQHPLGNLLQQPQQPGNRLPPGFPSVPLYTPTLPQHLQQQNHPQLPHPLLNQHSLPPNFHHLHQRQLPNTHLPIALNNFAMHPNFNAMRVAAAAAGIHPGVLVPPQQQQRLPPHPPNSANILNQSQSNAMFNMYNMRLMQEIQQNHPLLQNIARQQQQLSSSTNCVSNIQQHQQQRGCNKQIHHQHHRRADGNLPPEEFDEYANLMSTRDKHWLIGIQLSQLNTDTPYIDDFYYTVYKERKAQLNGDMRHSNTHKDNQLNHPLTQPKGHAQLILVQLGNKNGTRNGQHRERRNSETGGNSQEQKPTYIFTPLKFENSLGKLQYGSVTAPRKIIDADIMGTEINMKDIGESTGSVSLLSNSSKFGNIGKVPPIGAISEISLTQRKSRHILLHIETLYRIILKLEDLDNPNVMATIIMKKIKESERILALEQMENANKSIEEKAGGETSNSSLNPALKNKFAYEIETKDALICKLIAGLTHDKVVAMMNVRKGKALLRRIMPYIQNTEILWNVWIGIFTSLHTVVKKDREDIDGALYALYPELKKQIKIANFETIVKLSTAIQFNDKKSNGLFCSKFGISAVVCLILQAESIFVLNNDVTLNDEHKTNWRQFLDQVANSLNRTMQNHTICAAIESDSIQPMMNHFARFNDLKLDSLLALITEAKQQIN